MLSEDRHSGRIRGNCVQPAVWKRLGKVAIGL